MSDLDRVRRLWMQGVCAGRRVPVHGLLLGLLFALCTAGCSGDNANAPTEPVVAKEQPQALVSITVHIDSTTVTVGQRAQATASGIDQHGRPMTIGVPGWTSLQPAVAFVGADGVISARSAGQATIVASIGDTHGQMTVQVASLPPGPAPVAIVSVDPYAGTLEAGKLLQLAVTPMDYAGAPLTDRSITWTSSDSSVATVSPNGLVSAVDIGSAIIEATCEGKRGALSLTVVAASDTEMSVSIAQPLPQAVVGDSVVVIATVQSLFPITQAVATVAGKEVPMVFGHIGGGERAMGWKVTLNLSLLAFGPWDVIVTAIDSRDHRASTSVAIVRNPDVSGGGRPPAGNK